MKSEKAGGITDVVMSDCGNAVGLAKIKDFKGETMYINLVYLKQAIGMADALLEDVEDVEIGINNEASGGTFFVFLNMKKVVALVVAGRTVNK